MKKLNHYTCVLMPAAMAGLIGLAIGTGSFPVLTAHAQNGFTGLDLKGTFGFNMSGTAGTNTPIAAFGVLNADGSGGITGTEYTESTGSAALQRQFQGNYTVNADGTGTLNIVYLDASSAPVDDDSSVSLTTATILPATARYSFVIVGGKTELRSIRSDAGFVASAVFTKQ